MTGPRRKRVVSADVLHDLRNPLNQIIGYSEMLADDSADHGSLSADLQKIRAAGHRMLAIIEESFTAADATGATPAAPFRRTLSPAHRPADDIIVPEPAGETGLVLVVDDDEGNRDVLCRRLQQHGHQVDTVRSGPQALKRMQESSYDVVLLDIMMPEMDGYEVLRQIKSNETTRHLPVIMISAVNEMDSVVRCIEAGADDFLSKPFDATLLKARVGASLQKKRGRDREIALYEQLQKNFERLEQTEKLRDDLRNMIVHDLRTPLTSLMIGVEMIEKCGSVNPTQHELISLAVSGGTTLLDMINDLLDVEKMESGTAQLHYDEVHAAATVADAIRQVESLAREAGTAIVTEIEPSLRPFAADARKLGRTLVNLIANAIKFTGAGTVTVSASPVGDAHVQFSVRDTGAGIAPEEFERIFEKFGQVDRRSRIGTGLGLAFCKLAVEAHGGNISVESIAGVGSTFTFVLPLAAPQTVPDASEPVAAPLLNATA